MNRRNTIWLLCAMTGFLRLGPTVAAAAISTEEALALYVLNCAYYGTWPDRLNPRTTGQLRIAVVGKDPMGSRLEAVAARARASWFEKGIVEVVRAARPENLTGSFHIVFVAGSDRKLIEPTLLKFAGEPVMTVGNSSDFATEGGMVELAIRNERLTFVLNLDRLEAAGLVLHSRMKILAAGFIRNGRYEANERQTRGR